MSLRGDVRLINNASGAPAPIVIPNTTTVYSQSFKLYYGQVFGVWLQAGNGSGTANMKIQLEQSRIVPTTQGAADANWVIGDGVADVYSNLNDTNAHIKTLSPVPMKYGRFKITGLGSNPVDASITIWIFDQELIA